MSQCILCAKAMMQGKGNCTCLLDEKGVVKDCLTTHNCKSWILAPMDSVRARSTRKMTFNNQGVVILT